MKTLLLSFLFLTGLACSAQEKTSSSEKAVSSDETKNEVVKAGDIYQFKVKDINGKEFDFASLKGKKVMIVNTASECGLTPQYEQLQALHKEFSDENFVIIGFPCNDFMGQEPGTNEEIKGFCQKNYGVEFQMMDKISVQGKGQAPIYQFLTQKSLNGFSDNKVQWNFQKYLIDENGKLVNVISPRVLPNDASIVNWIKG